MLVQEKDRGLEADDFSVSGEVIRIRTRAPEVKRKMGREDKETRGT